MGTQEHWTAAQYREYLRQRAKGGNKYHAIKAQADGRTYDSRSECKRAKELQLLERHGLVRNLREQVPYELIPAGVGEYRKERPVPPDVQEFMQAWLAHLKSNRKAKAVS